MQNTIYMEGANFTHLTNLAETVRVAQSVDVIILCIGEDTYAEMSGNINTLMLSQSQITLANTLATLNKPIVLVYLGGRPLIITEQVLTQVTAALIAFLPGNRGGEAIADVLFARYNPNARMPITYPKFPHSYTTYDHLPTDEWSFNTFEYLFPFGHGLSYTTFVYSNLKLSTNKLMVATNNNDVNMNNNVFLTVWVDVMNVGEMAGKESVLVYVNDVYGSVARPVRQLKGFVKVELKVDERKRVRFNLSLYDLSFINAANERIIEAGEFKVFVGELNATFVLVKGQVETITRPEKKVNSEMGRFEINCGVFVVVILLILFILKKNKVLFRFKRYYKVAII